LEKPSAVLGPAREKVLGHEEPHVLLLQSSGALLNINQHSPVSAFFFFFFFCFFFFLSIAHTTPMHRRPFSLEAEPLVAAVQVHQDCS
jgi:hypothetical protein